MPGPDLHLHSTASDGACSPGDLVRLACAAALPGIALTDHDSVDGIAEALTHGRAAELLVIPGVELSASLGDRSVHILGYYIDHEDVTLCKRLEELRAVRIDRAERIVYALARDGFNITLDDVLEIADDGAVGRSHIARLLVEREHVASVEEAFSRLLGRTAPYYVPKQVALPQDVIGWIRDAGGVAVVAHPGLSGIDDLLPELIGAGIVGLEAYHGSHDAATRSRYAALARELGLIVTGGSDFHGHDLRTCDLGSVDVPESVLGDLMAVHRLQLTTNGSDTTA